MPHFLVRFMEHIERKGLDVVGIYRLSGNAASVNKLRYQVDQGVQHSSVYSNVGGATFSFFVDSILLASSRALKVSIY